MNVAYNMDCMEAMKQMPDNAFDLAVVDPPYGIDITGKCRNTQIGGDKPFGCHVEGKRITMPKTYHAFNDQKPPDAEYFKELKRVSKNQIIWGGNYFLEHLNSAPCMVFWDKGRVDCNFADGEIAWTSFRSPTRRFTYKWNGMLQENMKNKEDRIHPTQKPVALYRWLYQHFAKEGDKILDTHLGSGSSRIAAYDMGLDFTGYEIDKVYFQDQEERFVAYTAQMSLFREDDNAYT